MKHPRLLVLLLAALLGTALPAVQQRVLAQDADAAATSNLNLSRYTAVARPRREVVIAAAQDGLITDIPFEVGDTIAKGDLLVQMDDRVQQAVVALAEQQAANDAPVERARQQVRLQQTELDHLKSLATTSAATQREIEVAQVRLAQAQAELQDAQAQADQLRAQLELERQRLATLATTAPFAGVVLERNIDPGTTLRTADPILRLAQLNTLEVNLPLPAELYTQLEPGKTYTLAAGPPLNRPLSATLIRTTPEIDAASDTFIATFHLDNADQSLPAGFRVHLAHNAR